MKKILLYFILLLSISMLQAQFDLPMEPVNVIFNKKATGNEVIVNIVIEVVPDTHIYTSKDNFFKIEETKSAGLGKIEVILPKSTKYKDVDGTFIDVYIGKKVIVLKKKYNGKKGDHWQFSGFFQYQACDSSTCFPPTKKEFDFSGIIPKDSATLTKTSDGMKKIVKAETKTSEMKWPFLIKSFELEGYSSGYMSSDDFISFLTKKKQDSWTDNLAGKNILLVIGIILLGGLLLNLTPCVLPMIPINLAIIGAGVKASSKLKGFAMGLIYGLGLCIAYGILGIVVVLTGAQFGAINSSPWFNFGIAIFFVILALAMFDLIMIDFSRFRKGSIKKDKYGSYITPLLIGIVSALLAGACVAPVVISVLIYSNSLYSSGHDIGLLLPLLLGVGMALPWPFAGASLSVLPKPGKWMEKVKYLFGAFILLMALYYGHLGYKLTQTVQQNEKEGMWIVSLDKSLVKAKQENKSLFIDFWASWCKNCLAMNNSTFKNKKVIEKLKKNVLLKYRAENFDDPETKKVVEYFKKLLKLPTFGLPTYVILKPADKK